MTAIRAPAPPVPHGGRLDAARRRYPNAPRPWIDLSTGVNPRAYPPPPIELAAYARLPDDDALALLEAAARAAYAVPSNAEVVPAAGAQTLIQTIPRALPARSVGVLGFTYAEHAACWSAAGAEVAVVETLDALAAYDAAVIVNPNNPDGRLVAQGDIAELAATFANKKGVLVVDESFMDFTPHHSAAPLAAHDGLIVLRSLGKAYGLAGLRLGFALCAAPPAAPLRAALGPWAVSGPAIAVGARALADKDWLTAAARACVDDATRLDALLARAGLTSLGGTALFRLAAHERAPALYQRLCEHGILARAFDQRPGWLRFGLPGNEAAWRRLANAMGASDDR